MRVYGRILGRLHRSLSRSWGDIAPAAPRPVDLARHDGTSRRRAVESRMSTGTAGSPAGARRAVQVGHEQLMALIDHTSAVIYMRDADGHYLLVNREYERLFRLRREDIVGLTDHDLFPGAIADEF